MQTKVVFGHVNGGQFTGLHRYLNERNLADSWLLCSESYWEENRSRIPKLVPAARMHGGKSDKTSGAEGISGQFAAKICDLQSTTGVDVYVGHAVFGPVSAMVGRATFPLVTYAEFPSLRAHGWDSRFPANDLEQSLDRKLELFISRCVRESARVIVPSQYARNLFPEELRSKIVVQMEGFLFDETNCKMDSNFEHRAKRPLRIGFFARDLSLAKGFDQFVQIANRLAKLDETLRFVVIGGAKTPYGFESTRLQNDAAVHEGTFATYVLKREHAPVDRYDFRGLVPRDRLADEIAAVDIFLYPLQFGSANWGIFELLGRGAVVIASNRCYLPEIVRHGENGLLLEYGDIDAWVNAAVELIRNPSVRFGLSDRARTAAQRYSMDTVAPQYLEVLRREIRRDLQGPSEIGCC